MVISLAWIRDNVNNLPTNRSADECDVTFITKKCNVYAHSSVLFDVNNWLKSHVTEKFTQLSFKVIGAGLDTTTQVMDLLYGRAVSLCSSELDSFIAMCDTLQLTQFLDSILCTSLRTADLNIQELANIYKLSRVHGFEETSQLAGTGLKNRYTEVFLPTSESWQMPVFPHLVKLLADLTEFESWWYLFRSLCTCPIVPFELAFREIQKHPENYKDLLSCLSLVDYKPELDTDQWRTVKALNIAGLIFDEENHIIVKIVQTIVPRAAVKKIPHRQKVDKPPVQVAENLSLKGLESNTESPRPRRARKRSEPSVITTEPLPKPPAKRSRRKTVSAAATTTLAAAPTAEVETSESRLSDCATDDESDDDKDGMEITCMECSESFDSLRKLQRHHIKEHAAPKPFYCAKCNKDIHGARAFRPHLLVHYEKDEDGTQQCDMCEFSSHNSTLFLSHIQRHAGPLPFVCNECDDESVSYLTYSKLRQHMERTHLKLGNYACKEPNCGRSFHSKVTWLQHQQFHSTELKLCHVCGFSTKYYASLTTHQRIHTGEVFRCTFEECPYTTPKRGSMREHLKVHTGQKDYVCEVCNKSFVDKSNLKRHEQKHNKGRRRFTCDVCSRNFDRKAHLMEHMTRKHAGLSEDPIQAAAYMAETQKIDAYLSSIPAYKYASVAFVSPQPAESGMVIQPVYECPTTTLTYEVPSGYLQNTISPATAQSGERPAGFVAVNRDGRRSTPKTECPASTSWNSSVSSIVITTVDQSDSMSNSSTLQSQSPRNRNVFLSNPDTLLGTLQSAYDEMTGKDQKH